MESGAQSRGALFPMERLGHPTGIFLYNKNMDPLEGPILTEEIKYYFKNLLVGTLLPY